MSLPDRIDPRPPRRIYRWDLDKTYLRTEFDTFRQLVKTAFQKATEKVAVPGAAALIKELRSNGDTRLCIVSGSPPQMRSVLVEKLKLDGVVWEELVLKDNIRNLLRGRFRALRGQVGYKLPALLESRLRAPIEAEEVLFGDDAEADAFIYSLYADLIAGRISEQVLVAVLRGAEVYADDVSRIRRALQALTQADPVRRIFIHLDRLTPPAYFSVFGPRVVPVFDYFQAALVLMADGHLQATQVIRVGFEMIQTRGHNLLSLSHSLQDLVRRGLPLQQSLAGLVQALEGGAGSMLDALRPVPDIVAAFTSRFSVLGTTPPPPAVPEIDYLKLLDHARPRARERKR